MHVVIRANARALLDAGLVVEGVVGDAPLVVEHSDMGILDQLIAVPVTGDDDRVPPGIPGGGGEGGEYVVGLEALGLDHPEPQRLDQVPNQGQLLVQDVGLLLPVGLVGGQALVPEGGARQVERHRHPIGLVLPEQGDEHGAEAGDGIRDLSRGRHEVGG